jgi:DHA1 family bicyclomycin/chloramphenicol resistance-like MFS transporter
VLLRRFEPRNILLGAVIAGSVAGLFLLGIALLNLDGLIGVLLALWLVLFAVGLALPNAPAVALSRHGETAGTAAALLGAVQFGVGALVSPLVGVLGNNAVGMSTVVAGGLVLSMLVLVTVVRPWRLDDIEPAAVAVPAVTH